MFNYPTNGGLIKTIVIIIVALLILSYFGFNLRNLANSPTTQDNFSYVWNAVSGVWNNYLKAPAIYVYNIFIVYIWDPAINNLQNMKNNQPGTISNSAPTVPNPSPTP